MFLDHTQAGVGGNKLINNIPRPTMNWTWPQRQQESDQEGILLDNYEEAVRIKRSYLQS